MTTTSREVSVHRRVSVPLGTQAAFDLFTARTGAFWPREHSIGTAELADVLVEAHVGGRWYERGVDGSECTWGRVAAWEPPARVVLLWQIDADWRYDPDLQTEVEVTFTPDGPGRTAVELVHRHLERYGAQAESLRAVFDSPGGWTGTLSAYTSLAEAAAR